MNSSPDTAGLAADYAWTITDSDWMPLDCNQELMEPNRKALVILLNRMRDSFSPSMIAYEVAREIAHQETAEVTGDVLKRVLIDLNRS